MNLQPVMQAKRQSLAHLLSRKNVVACGVGFKESGGETTDELCLVVSVTKKMPEGQLSPTDLVPKTLGAVATDVQEVGIIRTLESGNGKVRTERWRPAPGGVSIGHVDVTAGTLGCLVWRGSEQFILSNNHVLANCFDDKTQVLTIDGWKSWKNVDMDTEFATRNSHGQLEYQKPNKLIKDHYSGKMAKFGGRWHDLLVTLNHRLFAKKSYTNGSLPKHMTDRPGYQDYFPMEAQKAHIRCETLSMGTIKMTSTFDWEGQELDGLLLPKVNYEKGKDYNRDAPIPIKPWLVFLGIYLGDGSATVRAKVRQYITQIRSTRPSMRRKVMDLCSDMGFNAFENAGAVRITNKQLTLYLKETFGGVQEKRIPREILMAPRHQLQLLWDGLMLSDGYIGKHGQEMIRLVNRGLIDDIQELALKLGKGASISQIDGSGYNPEGVYWHLGTHRQTFCQQADTQLVDYSGYVYCADVPNGTLLIRRNGKPCWSCNSNAGNPGDPIIQPGHLDGGTLDDQIAILEAFVPIDFGTDPPSCPIATSSERLINWLAGLLASRHRVTVFRQTAAKNCVDAAIARFIPHEAGVTEAILEVGFPKGAREATLGTRVKKSGRTTGLTSGQIIQFHVTVQVKYGEGKVALFEEQLMAGAMSQGGDSGSVVLDEDGYVVGLLFAGSDATTIINPIGLVLDALDVEIPGD